VAENPEVSESESGIIACPACGTELTSWQIECHGCGQSISSFEIPVIKGDELLQPDLLSAFQKWMRRGRIAFKNGSYDEAHACFAEALKRVRGIDAHCEEEIKARQKLADAFLKLNKGKEAVEQLVRAEHLSTNEEQKQLFQKRIDHLNKKVAQSGNLKFRQPRDAELMSALLYCPSCHRLLSESEVYRFRSGKQKMAKCICSFESVPVTPDSDSSLSQSLPVPGIEPEVLAPPLGIKKAHLIEAAHQPVEGGRDRRTAIWLAILLGNFGVHKFYLGEKASGIIYLAMCWTLIPWLVALYEAVHIYQMSRVSFNLVYNIEEIVRRLPADTDSATTDDFTMEVVEDPDDLVDAWSVGDETITSPSQV
jgi:tetratricopeptide (TPR) repeat protein